MENSTTYTQAKSRDMAFVIEMWRRMHAEIAASNPRYKVNEGGEFLWGRWAGDITKGENGGIILAEDRGDPVGFVLAFVPKDPPIYAARPRGRISDIYVRPEYRGKGIGKELLSRAVQFLKNKGVKVVEVNVPAGVESLEHLLRRTGMSMFAGRYALFLE